MSLNSAGQGAIKQNYSTTATLWGHLLHKKPTASPSSKPIASQSQSVPPIAPVDKAGASARLLLYDTQATLEKFAVQVDKLTAEVQDAKREVSASQKTFQHGHEKLLEEQVDLGAFGTRIYSA